jgi:serine/threonine protein kinase
MPLMEGGDVFDKIANMKKYDENIARNLVSDMIKAIAHLHENNIAHCDLKSRNLLLSSNNDDSSVILADFGFAARVYSPKSLTKQCGTPYFVAPEILLQNGYDTQSDMWSVGIIIYSLLSGGLPFTGKTHLELFKAIIKGGFDFNATQWDEVSASAKDLISKLLVKDPSSRLSAHDALRHSWIRADEHILQRNSLLNTSFRLKTFNARLTLKSAILATHSMIIWRNLTRDGKSKAAGISDIDRESHNNPHNVEVDEEKLLGIEESAKESDKES